MKTIYTTLAALLMATSAQAGPFGLPDHVRDGFRDTQCPTATRYQVEGTNYFSNVGCPEGGAGVSLVADEEPTDPVDEPTDGETPDEGPVDGGADTDTPVEGDPIAPVDGDAPSCRGNCGQGQGNGGGNGTENEGGGND